MAPVQPVVQPPQVPQPQSTVVASAPPAKPMTAEEREKRLKDLRVRMNASQIAVTPPAGKSGYWGPKDDSKEMGRLKWIGYSVVVDNPKKPEWVANGMQEDGTYVIGDVILMEIASDVQDMIQQEYLDRHQAMMTNTKSVFIADADAAGVPAFEVAKKR